MDLSQDFVLPPLGADKPVMSEEHASDTAFYAAASSSSTPIDDYHKVYAELMQTGESAMLDSVKQQFVAEQDIQIKQAVKGIIEDPTVPVDQKKSILSTYAVGGYLSNDIKDRYVQRSGALDLGSKPSDSQAQDEVLKSLPNRLAEVHTRQQRHDIVEGEKTFMSYFDATAATTANVVTGVAAGIVGSIYAIGKWDALAGAELFSKLARDMQVMPPEKASQEIMGAIGEKLSVLGIPAQAVKDYTMRATGSARAGIVAGVILDPLNFLPVGLATKMIKAGIKKVGPGVRAGSPLDNTVASNPKMAHDLALGALEDQSEATAKALGTNKAAIVNDFVLPKALSTEERAANPSLAADLDKLDMNFEEMWKASRFDPNVQFATRRAEDMEAVFSILNEARAPKYMQSQSHISPSDNVFEGRAVFGKDNSYYFSSKEDALNAYTQLEESIKRLPAEEQGNLFIVDKLSGTKYKPEVFKGEELPPGSVHQYSVEWDWKKEYDETNLHLFGPDSVKTSVLGMDASGFARTGASKWFFSHSTLPKWFENSALRQAERSAYVTGNLLEVIRTKIANTPFKKELDTLINKADTDGVEHFSKTNIQSMFPNLSKAQVDDLFETHTYWRRVNHYNYNVTNALKRQEYYNNKFTRGLYIEDSFTGAINPNIKFTSKAEVPYKVWDADLEMPVAFQWLDTKTDATYDVGGKRLASYAEPRPDPTDPSTIYEYVLYGGKRSVDDVLPSKVVPYVPGHTPLKTEGHFFVRLTPKKLVINGFEVNSMNVDKAKARLAQQRLATHSRVVGAAKTEFEAKKLQQYFQEKYPDSVVDYRPDRGADYGRIADDTGAKGELLRSAMKRGEKLISDKGPAPVEDRLVTLVNTTRSLARQNAMRVWEDATKKSFVEAYGDFLPDGKFPETIHDIKPKPNMNREDAKAFDSARRIWEYYAKVKTFETLGDHVWKSTLHHISDILEKWKIPANLVRDVANKGNLLFNVPRQVASMMFIHLNPLKQWLVQPAQLAEMYAINPTRAIQNFTDLAGIRMALGARSPILKGKGESFYQAARKMVPGMSAREFDDTIKALEQSGVLKSVDQNMLVHGVIHDANRGLTETSWEKLYNDMVSVPKAAVGVSRAVGFDFAELNNRIGLWLQVRDLWKQQNPGKNWNTLEARETIAVEALKLSGAMNRAGSLPYQQGALSILFQFAAISQKLMFNLIQDNATILTPVQRAKLTAARTVLWGAKYGLPAGALMYMYVDQSKDQAVKDNAEILKRGLADRVFNYLLEAMTGSESSDAAVGKAVAPFGQSTSGLPYMEVMFEMAKMFDEGSGSPTVPSLGAITTIGETIDKYQSWFITKEVTGESWNKAVWETTKLASGMNNWAKAQLMLSIQDKVTKNGNKLGMKATAAEAYAQMLGITTYREEDLWEAANQFKDRSTMINNMATEIHRSMVNIERETGDTSWQTHQALTSSFMSMLENDQNWTRADIYDLRDAIIKLDRQTQTTVKDSLLMKLYKDRSSNNDEQLRIAEDKLRPSMTPETIELLDILDGKRKP